MTYTKNHDPWADSDLVTTTIMDNFETIYTEASSYLSTHTHDDLYQTKAEMEAAYWYAGNDGSGSGADADLIFKSTGNLHAASFAGLGVPTGLIVMWSGGSVPSGWHLCDGAGGTIDLRGKFVIGAGTGGTYSPGDTGGSATFTASGSVSITDHCITITELPAHTHTFEDYYPNIPGGTSWTTAYGGSGGYNQTYYSSGNSSTAGSGNGHGHSAAEGTGFTGDAVACLPFYYALAFIQKV